MSNSQREKDFLLGVVHGLTYVEHMLRQTRGRQEDIARVNLIGQGIVAINKLDLSMMREWDNFVMDLNNRLAQASAEEIQMIRKISQPKVN